MGYLGFFYVEKKSFEFRSDVRGGVRLKEWSKGVHRWVIMAWPTISWFSEACGALSASGNVEGKYETFRFGDRRYVLMRRRNSFGSFMELSEYGGGGKSSSVIIPEGLNGMGWKDCQEQLLKLKQHHVRALSACNGATLRKVVTQHGLKDEKVHESYAEAVKSGSKAIQNTSHLGVNGAQAGFSAGESQEVFFLGNGESMKGSAGLEKHWEGKDGQGRGKKTMEEYFSAFRRLMTEFREEFDSFLENVEKVWASVGAAGDIGSDPAAMKKHAAFGPNDGPCPGQPVNRVSRDAGFDKDAKEGKAKMDHEKPKSGPFSVKPPIRLITYARRRASKKVWRVKSKGRGSSPAAGEISLPNRCGSPMPAASRDDAVVQAGSDSLQMFLGDHHLSVLKDQGTGSKSLPCAIILPSGSSGSCAPWRTEDACFPENVDSGMIVPYVQAEERLPDILCVRDISETAVEQCAAEEVQEVVPLTI
jgi:hypothetical protein